MTATQDDTIAELQRTVAELRQERDGALSEKAALAVELAVRTAELATRNSEFGERIEHQSATIDVLRAMSASPGDAQPVFELIVERARDLCDAYGATVYEFDGTLIHYRAATGVSDDATVREQVAAVYPIRATHYSGPGRAILDRRIIRIDDLESEPGLHPILRRQSAKSAVFLPLLRGNLAMGALSLGSRERGGFSDSQIELLKTFAEQAVIAITSAETYRALQTRTSDLQESLEYQTATSDVLKVISGSEFELEPVFQAVVETAERLCRADQAVIYRYHDGVYRWAAGTSLLPDYERIERSVSIPPGTGTVVGRAALEHRPIEILDALADPLYEVKDDARVGGIRTLLGVPLMRDGTSIGVIGLARQRVEAFTEQQIELVKIFADQAVIAIENTRLITEQREALEQQTATAEVLQVINASPGDLAPVFDAMLKKALRLCGAAFGTLYTYDGENFKPVAFSGVAPGFAELMTKYPPTSRPGSPAARTLETKRPVDVPDLMEEEVYRSGAPAARGLVEVGGFRAFINVPLVKDEKVLGLFTIYRNDVGNFSDKQIALLENFAAQAVIAMENTRLINEQQEALEQRTATAEVLQVINASPGNLAPVFEAMLDKALGLCNAAFGILWTYDGTRGHADALRGVPPAFAEYLTRGPHPVDPGGVYDRLLSGEPMVHIADAAKERAYRSSNPLRRALVELGRARTLLAVPLRKDNVYLGHFVIYRREVRLFSDKQIVLLQNFAAQAVIAMENARLLNEIRQRQEELRITFENMGDGVALFDETQRLIAWNRKFQDILDVPDDIIARRQTFSEYVHYLAERGEYGREANPEEHVRRLIEQAGQSRTYERTRPDGRVIEVRNNPVAGGGFVLIFSDITERKRNEAEIRATRDAAEEASRTIEAAYRELKTAQANLIQAEKMASLGQLTAGIAHEIKNPLNFVNNFAELSVDLLGELKDAIAPAEPALTEKQRAEIEDISAMLTSNLEKITEHGKRADGIVKAMLEHSRGSSGERRVVDLNALIDEALNLAYHGARAQNQSFNITLERDFGEDLAPIEVNPQDITRVFLNIFSNGFYAATRQAREGGDAGFVPTLKVTTRDCGEAVEIRVRDNGTGIPVDIRDKLFQPFFTTKPTGEGTGLGLSITYDIVTQQHDGSIAVDSNVGEYSEFTIRLPRKP